MNSHNAAHDDLRRAMNSKSAAKGGWAQRSIVESMMRRLNGVDIIASRPSSPPAPRETPTAQPAFSICRPRATASASGATSLVMTEPDPT